MPSLSFSKNYRGFKCFKLPELFQLTELLPLILNSPLISLIHLTKKLGSFFKVNVSQQQPFRLLIQIYLVISFQIMTIKTKMIKTQAILNPIRTIFLRISLKSVRKLQILAKYGHDNTFSETCNIHKDSLKKVNNFVLIYFQYSLKFS